jgi:tartrate dehydratase beta subunit/fumarate hydratase class I family protein
MSEIVPADRIESIVGVKRHPFQHVARAISAEQTVYILHADGCAARLTHRPLTECRYSRALDNGIDTGVWRGWEDRPVVVTVDVEGRLRPIREAVPDDRP